MNLLLIDSCIEIKAESEIPLEDNELKSITDNGYFILNDDDENKFIKEVAYEDTPDTVVEINKKILELKTDGVDDK